MTQLNIAEAKAHFSEIMRARGQGPVPGPGVKGQGSSLILTFLCKQKLFNFLDPLQQIPVLGQFFFTRSTALPAGL